MRDLKASNDNLMIFTDGMTNTKVGILFRTPTTEERVAFQKKSIKRKGHKVKFMGHETRHTYGLKIITGLREGDFGYDGKAISSDSASEDYREDWKALLEETASDLIAQLAQKVFEVKMDLIDIEDDDDSEDPDSDSDDSEEEKGSPLDQSSQPETIQPQD